MYNVSEFLAVFTWFSADKKAIKNQPHIVRGILVKSRKALSKWVFDTLTRCTALGMWVWLACLLICEPSLSVRQ